MQCVFHMREGLWVSTGTMGPWQTGTIGTLLRVSGIIQASQVLPPIPAANGRLHLQTLVPVLVFAHTLLFSLVCTYSSQ